MKKIILTSLLISLCTSSWGHEQWLLSTEEMNKLAASPKPLLFTELTLFNASLISLIILGIILWVFLTDQDRLNREKIKPPQIDWALFSLRLGAGIMLILCALGLLPKTHIPFFQEPTLFAPDLLIHTLAPFWFPLQWVELGLGIWLVVGIFTRLAAAILIALIIISLGLYSASMIHYSGFYLGASTFLIINGGGKFALRPSSIKFYPFSLLILQILTGINLIYSALCIKWATPNVDVFLLKKTHAFTFGIPYEEFVFIMLLIEIAFGILFIIGRKLGFISLILLSLFILLSLNLSENILAHSLIYGILAVFILLDGYPVYLKRKFN